MKDELGDRMKGSYESLEKDRFMSRLPIYARIDGRKFSTFTKPLNRPFDTRMQLNMRNTLECLVKEFNADLGYTQSDEISLFWLNEDRDSSTFDYRGIKQKLCSLLAGYTSSKFQQGTVVYDFPQNDGRVPHFDCRVLQLPNRLELWNMLLWRVKDCHRNAIQMMAQSMFSHKKLQKVKTRDVVKMIEGEFSEPIEDIINPLFLNGILCFKESYTKMHEGEEVVRSRIASGFIEELGLKIKEQSPDYLGAGCPINMIKTMELSNYREKDCFECKGFARSGAFSPEEPCHACRGTGAQYV